MIPNSSVMHPVFRRHPLKILHMIHLRQDSNGVQCATSRDVIRSLIHARGPGIGHGKRSDSAIAGFRVQLQSEVATDLPREARPM